MSLAVKGTLTLNRRVGESIMIGDNIIVKVMDIGHKTVSLSVMAPRIVPVLREELLAKKKALQNGAKEMMLTV